MTPSLDEPVFGNAPIGAVATVRPSAYALIRDAGGRIAVVRTPQGMFLPGGGMDAGETPDETIVREVREECGLEVEVGAWTRRAVDFVYSPTERTHFEKHSTFAEARISNPCRTTGEADHVLLWLSPEEGAAQLSHPSHRWAVAQRCAIPFA